MRTLVSCFLASLLLVSVHIISCNDQSPLRNTSVGFEKNRTTELDPCCNNFDPRKTKGPTWHVYCSGGDIQIDSQCCANLWNYFGGPPPPSINCTSVYNLCPETEK